MDPQPDEISLRDLFDALWSRRWLITACAVGFGIVAVGISYVMPEKYVATVVLSPVEDDTAGKLGGAGALLSQFGGLSSLAGLSGGSGRRAIAVATLQSHALTETFIRDNDLVPVLYAHKWDAAKKTWKTTDPDEIPTPWKAERRFAKKVRDVSEDKKSGLVTLAITWTDPKLAAQWATELVSRANRDLRTRAINESQINLAYLNEQLTKTSVVELQKAISSLIEAEIKKVMIANGREEFAFRVVDPAQVAEERDSPKRALISVLGFIVGLVLGVMVALALPARSKAGA
ncbi:MAG: Wzz/FepE/Etk N-terminal domain-containing protein [Gammaproteobacteria bacterium]|jgi:uncharacterized protein involved in exopolysaccharide biosynthesis|nr:Wzz/FepE/Etk N-terminal domain-containing protein [Gammaproteobacteria bacterium]